MSEAKGFFRFGMAYAVDQLTVRLRAIQAVSEVQSVDSGPSILRLWLAGDRSPVCIGYGSKSGADHDRGALMAALLQDAA